MKHLKHFESFEQTTPLQEALTKSDIQFHKDQIRDLFQDIIDEYGIDEEFEMGDDPGLYYMIKYLDSSEHYTKKDVIEFSISINFNESEDEISKSELERYEVREKDENLQLYNKYSSIKKDLKSLDKRLKGIYKFTKGIRSSHTDGDETYGGSKYLGEWWVIIDYEFNI